MTTIERTPETEALERMISECFRGGEVCRRELRLSGEQARRVAERYPASRVRPMGGSWYEITFQGALHYGS